MISFRFFVVKRKRVGKNIIDVNSDVEIVENMTRDIICDIRVVWKNVR